MTPTQLKCNYARNPLGVETPVPLLSWILEEETQDAVQSGYRVLVATSREILDGDRGDAWDSSIVESKESCGIEPQGISLESSRRYWWKVRCKGDSDEWSDWSEEAWFETGLLRPEDWRAKWIQSPVPNLPPRPGPPKAAPLFRKSFRLEEDPISVRAYVCGLGYYELYANEEKCGDAVLTPAVSRYDATVYYDSYDLTGTLRKGLNALALHLGNGWYDPGASDVWDFQYAPWRDHPKMILQVDITYPCGKTECIVSDSRWKVSLGPIQMNRLRNGEFYDARCEQKGWMTVDFDDAEWNDAQIARPPGGIPRSAQDSPIRVIDEIPAVSVKEVEPGVHVFDFGRNISGWGLLRIVAEAGTEVTLKYSELVDDQGRLDTKDIDLFVTSGEFQTDRYIAKGGAVESWHPRFTYHGFRYIQLSGLGSNLDPETLQAAVVHTDLPDAGAFECSVPLLNTIQTLARRSTVTNYHSIPTDCPHREKNGWTGDSVLSAEQVLLNFDPVRSYRKWIRDIMDAQRPSGQIPGIVPTGGWGYNWGSGPAWDSALILIPWYSYVYSADKHILEDSYPAMTRYLDFLVSMTVDGIVDFGLGDWCPPGEKPWDHQCPTVVTDTAYAFVDYVTVARIAAILGKNDDAHRFRNRAQTIRTAFRGAFVDSSTGSVAGDSQTALACALYQGLLDEAEKPKVVERLVREVERNGNRLNTGILGTKYLLHALSQNGRTDIAFAVATQTEYPSWGHWIEQGATTLWERWDGRDSQNHHMYSDISAWFYRELAGLQPDPEEAGFQHTLFQPNPVEGLSWAKAHHDSPFGRIESSWSVESGRFALEVSIPANGRGTISLPQDYTKNLQINGQEVRPVDYRVQGSFRRPILKVGSGRYEITATSA